MKLRVLLQLTLTNFLIYFYKTVRFRLLPRLLGIGGQNNDKQRNNKQISNTIIQLKNGELDSMEKETRIWRVVVVVETSTRGK